MSSMLRVLVDTRSVALWNDHLGPWRVMKSPNGWPLLGARRAFVYHILFIF